MNTLFVSLFCVCVGAAVAARNPSIMAEGPNCDMPPRVEAPAGPINITAGHPDRPFVHIPVGGGSHEGGIIAGLQGLKYVYNFNLIGMKLTFDVNVAGKLCIDGDSYNAKGNLDFGPFRQETLPTGAFEGSGSYHACLTNSHVAGTVNIKLNLVDQTVTVTAVDLEDLSADAVEANLGKFVCDGKETDWEQWTADFKDNFDQDWENEDNKAQLEERVIDMVDELLKGKTLEEIIEEIGQERPCPPPAP